MRVRLDVESGRPHLYIIAPPQLAITPGTRLGPYEIIAAIGAGGMGEVYRADARHPLDGRTMSLAPGTRRGSGEEERLDRK